MITDQIREILGEVGYTLYDYGQYFRARPLYRESDNNTVLSINKEDGKWVDFKTQQSGNLEELIRITLGLKDSQAAQEFLSGRLIPEKASKQKPIIKSCQTFSVKILERLNKDYSYWNNRGVSNEVMSLFEGGVAAKGKMYNRFVFPIFNSSGVIIGFSGRYIYDIPEGRDIPKWKHIGNKKEWKYPLKVNSKILQELKNVILVESIGDMLALWGNGIKNVMVVFGLNVSPAIINTLISLDPNKITIAFNNDLDHNGAGNIASEKALKKLRNYFDQDQLHIKLPKAGDFGEMDSKEIGEWALGAEVPLNV